MKIKNCQQLNFLFILFTQNHQPVMEMEGSEEKSNMKNSNLSALTWNSLIATEDLPSLQAMLDKGEISRKDKIGKYELSPLHLAVWHNKPEVCKFLLSQKIAPNIKETFSAKTPIHIAAYFGYVEIATILIEFELKVADRNSTDLLGCHPLHYAALGEKEQMLFLLLKFGHFLSPLDSKASFSASLNSRLGNTLDILIRRENFELCDLISSTTGISIVDTNPRIWSTLYIGYLNENQWTPFHSVAVLGEKKIAEMLLRKFPHAYCFNEEFEDVFDYFPDEVALIEGHKEVASILEGPNTTTRCQQTFNRFFVHKNAPLYSNDLLKALSEKDFYLMDKLIEEHGEKILFEYNFYEPHEDSHYMTTDKLNALSIISRLFSVSFANWFKEKKIYIPIKEFMERDQKEMTFFNWAMMDIHPYATGFFAEISKEIETISSKGLL